MCFGPVSPERSDSAIAKENRVRTSIQDFMRSDPTHREPDLQSPFLAMNSAWISAFSAVMGSSVGALTSFLTTYINERNQSRRDFLNKQFAQRETLYSEFIEEAARLFADSGEHQLEKMDTLVPIYALLNRIRLKSSEEVVRAAQKTIEDIIKSYNLPNLTAEWFHNLPASGSDPLMEFGEACRKELNTLYSTT